MHKFVLASSCALLAAATAHAQTTPAAKSATAPAAAVPAKMVIAPPIVSTTPEGVAVLRTGTEVPLRTSEMLTTKGKKLRVGQRIRLEVAEPVMVQGLAVIPAGSPVVGEITEVKNKGMWGKSGRLNARVLYATVNGRQIRMGGNFDDKGTAGGWGAAAASAIVFLPAGFFMTGTSATVPLGAPVKGFVDEDVPLSFAAVGPAPLLVGTPAAPVVVTTPVAPVAATSAVVQPTTIAASAPR